MAEESGELEEAVCEGAYAPRRGEGATVAEVSMTSQEAKDLGARSLPCMHLLSRFLHRSSGLLRKGALTLLSLSCACKALPASSCLRHPTSFPVLLGPARRVSSMHCTVACGPSYCKRLP